MQRPLFHRCQAWQSRGAVFARHRSIAYSGPCFARLAKEGGGGLDCGHGRIDDSVSDDLLVASGKPRQVVEDELRVVLAMKLFELRQFSLGKAAELAGMGKVRFMDELGRCIFRSSTLMRSKLRRRCVPLEEIIIADSSPLIGLARIAMLPLLRNWPGESWCRQRCGWRSPRPSKKRLGRRTWQIQSWIQTLTPDPAIVAPLRILVGLERRKPSRWRSGSRRRCCSWTTYGRADWRPD